MADKREECLWSTLALKAIRGRLPTKPATLILQTIHEGELGDAVAPASRATKLQLINPVLLPFLLFIGRTKCPVKSIKRLIEYSLIEISLRSRTFQSLVLILG